MFKNESVQQFLGDMYQNVNIYDNYITVFGKSFISPVADFGLVTYHYYLADSAFLNNKWCYKLDFIPKLEVLGTISFENERIVLKKNSVALSLANLVVFFIISSLIF